MIGQLIKNELRIMWKEYVWGNWRYNSNTLAYWRNRRQMWIRGADHRPTVWASFTHSFTIFL